MSTATPSALLAPVFTAATEGEGPHSEGLSFYEACKAANHVGGYVVRGVPGRRITVAFYSAETGMIHTTVSATSEEEADLRANRSLFAEM
jgi:hypothetical protein